jgi:hypothetical protein
MKKITLLLLTVLITSLSYGQDLTQTIRGTIIDKQSQFPLFGVNLIVVDSDPLIGVSSDLDGRFRLENVPIGRHTIQVTYLGYESITISNLMLTSAKELEVTVELEESIAQLSTVVVRASDNKREAINQLATVSARTFSVEEAGRYSGSLNDPSRMAQNYAGVSGASDDRNDIIIRGNSPTGVLWRMEGVDIPSPNHFSTIGTTGGPISMLNINNLSNSDFMTSAWSADYGNALSGVFDLRLRNGNSDKREYLGQIGFNGLELGAEGPIKKGKRASYLINYRYSTLGVFKSLGIDLGTGDAVPEYQDVTFKLDFPTEKAGHFAVWGIGGVSNIELESTADQDTTNLYEEFENSTFNSNTGVLGASHTYFFNNSTYSKLTLAATAVQTKGKIDSLIQETNTYIPTVQFDRKQYRYSAHLKFNKKLSAKHNLSAGTMLNYSDIDFVDTVLFQGEFLPIANYTGNATLLQSYVNWQNRTSDNFVLNLGVHQQYFLLNNSVSIEPRLGMKYTINERHTLNFGAGLHSQLQPIVVYFSRDDFDGASPNINLDFTKSAHFVLGHDYYFGDNMRLKTEVYYQYLYDIPVDIAPSSFSMMNAGADFVLPTRTGIENGGTANNYGLEMTLEKFFSQGYYFLVTASLFNSKYAGSDNVKRNTLYNGNYVFNALGGKEFTIGNNKTLSLDSKVTYAGGRRYTPIDLEASRFYGKAVFLEEEAFSQQMDDYFRLDFKVTFRMNGKKTAQEWSVDLMNITDYDNVFQRVYSKSAADIQTTYQRGFFPNVQYKIYF